MINVNPEKASFFFYLKSYKENLYLWNHIDKRVEYLENAYSCMEYNNLYSFEEVREYLKQGAWVIFDQRKVVEMLHEIPQENVSWVDTNVHCW